MSTSLKLFCSIKDNLCTVDIILSFFLNGCWECRDDVSRTVYEGGRMPPYSPENVYVVVYGISPQDVSEGGSNISPDQVAEMDAYSPQDQPEEFCPHDSHFDNAGMDAYSPRSSQKHFLRQALLQTCGNWRRR